MNADDYRVAFEDHRGGLEFEHDLINRKVTWLLTSQTLLFAALGLTLQAPSLALVRIVAAVGLAICVTIAVGLVGNIVAKFLVHSDYANLTAREGDSQPVQWGVRGTGRIEFGVRTWTTKLGVIADFTVPLVFMVGWIAVLIMAEDIVNAARLAAR